MLRRHPGDKPSISTSYQGDYHVKRWPVLFDLPGRGAGKLLPDDPPRASHNGDAPAAGAGNRLGPPHPPSRRQALAGVTMVRPCNEIFHLSPLAEISKFAAANFG